MNIKPNLPSKSIVAEKAELVDGAYRIKAHLRGSSAECPHCHRRSSSLHSRHLRRIEDLPIQGSRTVIDLTVRHFRCRHCGRIFTEKCDFCAGTAHKTDRLKKRILEASAGLSSVKCARELERQGISVKKSTICSMVKKNG